MIMEFIKKTNSFFTLSLLFFLSLFEASASEIEPLVEYDSVSQKMFAVREGIAFPTGAHFQEETSGKQLYYVAARHANHQNHLTCQLIQEAIQSYKPDVLILEGFDNDPDMIEALIKEDEGIDLKNCSEVEYAIHLALKNEISFVGAEPTEDFIRKKLKKQGYQEYDITYRDFIGSINESVRRGQNFESLKEYYDAYFSGGDVKWFESWYSSVMNEDPSLEWFKNSECTAPIKDGDYVQKLTHAISDLRNENILKTIDKSIEEYDRPMVIYGCSHYFQQHSALFKKYGHPTYKKQPFMERYLIHIKDIFGYIFGTTH
jgi:hypothetical protein